MTIITPEDVLKLLDIPYSDTFEQAQGKIARLRDMAPDLARSLIAAHEALTAETARADAAEAEVKRLADQDRAFEKADWFWRTMDPDDCGDSPEEAINRGMVGRFCICEIASSFSGPTRYGFIAPVLDPESDDEEFVHFATQLEAMKEARRRAALAQQPPVSGDDGRG